MKSLVILIFFFLPITSIGQNTCPFGIIKTGNKELIFDNLKNGDVIILNYSSSGCFYLSVEKIVFSKKNDVIKAQVFITDKLIKTKVLTNKNRSYLIDFEQKVKRMNKNTGCTNTETYAFLLNNTPQFITVDSSCSWSGYELLKKEIF